MVVGSSYDIAVFPVLLEGQSRLFDVVVDLKYII